MASRNEKDRTKQIQDKCQTILNQLLKDEDNKYCVDCDAKGPRWASWNLGIFLCIRCAGIHRNLGVHISKVKSVNLDSWTPEQVVTLQQMGNSRARAVYEANLPDSFRRPQTDSALEAFVRAKYEHRKYVAREWVPPSPPKVNWDKEIDDEIERQKKKKKSSSSGTTTTLGSGSLSSPADKKANKSSEVVPQLLPKPKSSASPKPGRTTPKRESGGTADLLGTSAVTSTSTDPKALPSAADDVFSSFLSAPHTPANNNKSNQPENKIMDLKTEEESFFNQPAPSEKEKSKMTKDSILALYGQAPTTQNLTNPQFPPNAQNGAFNATFPQNSMFSQPQFQQQQQPQQPNAFGQSTFNNGFPAQSAFAQNGASQQNTQQNNSFPCNFNNQFAAPPQQNAFSQFPQQFSALNSFSAPNSFSGQLGNAFSSAPNHFPQAGGQFQASNMNGGFMPANGQQSLFNMPANNIQQQFGSMSLGHQAGQVGSMNNAFPASQNLQSVFPASAQTNMAANSVWQ